MEGLVRQMSSKRGFPRDVRAFTAVIRAYGRAGLWREALELVSTMKVGKVVGCCCCGEYEEGRLPTRIFISFHIPHARTNARKQ